MNENTNDDAMEDEVDAPTGNWVICSSCSGDGSHSKRFGAMTSSEFHETFDDEESRADYFAGAYDEPCHPCGGTGKYRDTQEARNKLDDQQCRDRISMTGRNEAGEWIGYC